MNERNESSGRQDGTLVDAFFPNDERIESTILVFVLAHLAKSAEYVFGGCHDIEAANSLRGNVNKEMVTTLNKIRIIMVLPIARLCT